MRQTLILLRFDAFFCLYEPYEISLSPSKAAIREPIYDVIVVRHRVEKNGVLMKLACIIHSKTPIGHNGLVLL